ncbi:ABC transporter substrate-binding protein [Proteobacteria bacterium 005FR1]|nr:ABC transporter substrate-binding protein [Proteobacteria bacterium 005FR1]
MHRRRLHEQIQRNLLHLLTALVLLVAPGAFADSAERITIGYLDLAEDPRYAERSAYARIQLRSQSRPLPGAKVAVDEANQVGQFLGLSFELEHFRGRDLDDVLAKLSSWADDGEVRFVLLDLPAELTAELAAKSRNKESLLFNISAPQNSLRGSDCQPQLMHTHPSYAMLTDALVQYLVSRNWRELYALQGELAADAEWTSALRHSAKRFGAELVAVRPFRLGNDPRQRERNNIALLTAGESYDVVIVADTEGEFGRYVPYQTKAPRPVAGTTGLVPQAWSWVWERHGAPQLNERFFALAKREMHSADWAAWVAVKAIAQAAVRTRSTEFAKLAAFLHSEELNLDGGKGPALSFRAWDNQLRQPILLATHDAVIARAPVDGFLHPRNTLDSLGADAGESDCDMKR